MSSEIAALQTMAVAFPGDGFRASAPQPLPVSTAPLPVLPAAAPADAGLPDRELIAQAVGELADYVQKANAELNFRIDDESGRLVVSLVDSADGTVLMQLPSEEALRIAKLLAQCEPCLIDQTA